MRDLAYGNEPLQKMDLYLPTNPVNAPVIFMVHGGAWRYGDKGTEPVVRNKVKRWVPRGFIFISVNYRLNPTVMPLDQAHDIALALAFAQSRAGSWGGDPKKFILMGHSAGAHLASLLTVAPDILVQAGAMPILGAVLLDAGSYDVPFLLGGKHAPIFDQPFGTSQSYWKSASPVHRFTKNAKPFLAVCKKRGINSCPQAQLLLQRANSFGLVGQILVEQLTHKEINQQLGLEGPYTMAIENFMGSLDTAIKERLTNPVTK